MSAIRNKLVGLKKKYSLSTSDLAVLLGVNRTTVHWWVEGDQTPLPNKKAQLEDQIAAIAAVAGSYFPVPLSVNQYQRKQYLLDALNGRAPRISKSGTPAKG